ncbi:MAG: HNH endonuclease [Gammaproteobacteria bacterium]|nr:HNH endonuclease [Gammaproteobacteria bacterium]
MKSIGSDPGKIATMKEAGLSNAQIAKIAGGNVPKGYNVHHKIPLDGPGTNDFDNLVLIRNNSEHYTITNAQRDLTSHIPIGDTVKIEFPVPPGFLYPLKGLNR